MTNQNFPGSMSQGPDVSILKSMIEVLHLKYFPFENMRGEILTTFPEMQMTLEQVHSLDQYINNISQISPEYTTHMYLVNLNYKMIQVEKKLDIINASILEQAIRSVNVQYDVRELKTIVENVLSKLSTSITETKNIINTNCSEIKNNLKNLTNIVVNIQGRGRREVMVELPERNEQDLTFLRDEINNLRMFLMDFQNFLSNWKREQEEYWDRYF